LGQFDGLVVPSRIRQATTELNAALVSENVPLRVVPGADVRVDERLPNLLDTKQILTLADGGRYLLLELPDDIFVDVTPLLALLAARGITGIVSHPERHSYVLSRPGVALPWLEHGALLQVTAGSLMGDFGPRVEAAAWHFLSSGMAALVATDCHNLRERRPRMADAIREITRVLGRAAASRMCIANPAAVLAGAPVRMRDKQELKTWR
jgi:protein-tyrosine phosphatase